MMNQFRLPDPPPELRARILEEAGDETIRASHSTGNSARGRHWGTLLIAGACVLLVGVLWTIFAVPLPRPIPTTAKDPLQSTSDHHARQEAAAKQQNPEEGDYASPTPQPDALVCKVQKTADGSQFLVSMKLLAGDKVIQEPTLAVLPGQWATMWVGEKTKGWAFESGKDEEPRISEVEVISSGNVMIAKCDTGKNGNIDVKVRSHYFANMTMVWSLKQDFQVASGEERILRKAVSMNARDQDIRDVIKTIEQAAGKRFMVSPQVKGTLTCSINNVPWDDALSAIVKTLGFRVLFEKDGTVRVVAPEDKK